MGEAAEGGERRLRRSSPRREVDEEKPGSSVWPSVRDRDESK